MPTLEINGSFYSLQHPSSWRTWFEETPDNFVFSVKAPRFITHIHRLRDIDSSMANFFASGVLLLGHKFGPLLWQFPPNFQFDPANFEPFLAGLPFDTDHARWIAAHHDERVADRHWFKTSDSQRLRHAVEVRHPSFADPDFVRLLRDYNVAFVTADTTGRWPEYDDITADFAYFRLHGSTALYRSAYTDDELDTWAHRISCACRGQRSRNARLIAPQLAVDRRAHDVFCYFDNTDKLQAPLDAARLRRRTGA
jgi:uncharacterized protein YecE (DUF72 family)